MPRLDQATVTLVSSSLEFMPTKQLTFTEPFSKFIAQKLGLYSKTAPLICAVFFYEMYLIKMLFRNGVRAESISIATLGLRRGGE